MKEEVHITNINHSNSGNTYYKFLLTTEEKAIYIFSKKNTLLVNEIRVF